MKADTLLTLLQSYHPTTEEVEYRKQMLAFIAQHDDCFERSLEIGHITASAWLLNNDYTHALLMHHRKLDIWIQPGGHCDGDADVLGVALKEAQEETGIDGIKPISTAIFDIDVHRIPQIKDTPAHDHYDVRFLCSTTTSNEYIQNHESKELRWFSIKENLPIQERSVLRMAEKWRKNYY